MNTVLYHANCNDGSASALAAWLSLGDDASYIPVQYGLEPPEIEPSTMLYILDFSYPREVIKDLAGISGGVVIIDHHKTAREDLRGYIADKVKVIYNVEECGATLSWLYFHGKPIPKLFRYIKDRDLWLRQYPETDGIAKALQLTKDFRDLVQFIHDPNSIVAQGEVIQSYIDMQCKIFVEHSQCQQWEGHQIPLFNAPGFLISDLLHLALEKHPDAPFAVSYFDLGDKRIFSLRSRQGSDVDVSKIVKKYGGGGHKHAAGFSRSLRGGNRP